MAEHGFLLIILLFSTLRIFEAKRYAVKHYESSSDADWEVDNAPFKRISPRYKNFNDLILRLITILSQKYPSNYTNQCLWFFSSYGSRRQIEECLRKIKRTKEIINKHPEYEVNFFKNKVYNLNDISYGDYPSRYLDDISKDYIDFNLLRSSRDKLTTNSYRKGNPSDEPSSSSIESETDNQSSTHKNPSRFGKNLLLSSGNFETIENVSGTDDNSDGLTIENTQRLDDSDSKESEFY
ncbi:hypothetical protein ACJJTC_015220 [Scirpophaga incertulas]